MNKSNPLLPQGSLLEQQSKGRRRVKFYVYFVGIFHLVVLGGGLIMLGCGKEADTTKSTKEVVSLPPIDTNPPPVETPVAPPPSTNVTVPPPLPVISNPPPVVTPVALPPVTPVASPSEYKVVKGDSYYVIHKKFGVTIAALEAANPSVPATKLRPGMTLQIPAAAAATATSVTAPGVPAADSGEMYTVKSKDTLSLIAKSHHTSVKALKAVNNLKTDRLKVGDKLKLPPPSAKPAAAEPAAVAMPPVAPAPSPASLPPGGVVR